MSEESAIIQSLVCSTISLFAVRTLQSWQDKFRLLNMMMPRVTSFCGCYGFRVRSASEKSLEIDRKVAEKFKIFRIETWQPQKPRTTTTAATTSPYSLSKFFGAGYIQIGTWGRRGMPLATRLNLRQTLLALVPELRGCGNTPMLLLQDETSIRRKVSVSSESECVHDISQQWGSRMDWQSTVTHHHYSTNTLLVL